MERIRKKIEDHLKYYPILFTCLFVIVLFQYQFTSLESLLYDLKVKNDIVMSNDNNIVLVTLDDESDEFLGDRYPYTYATHERALSKLVNDNPAIISYFVKFNRPTTDREKNNIVNIKKSIADFSGRDGLVRLGIEMGLWREELPPVELQDVGYSISVLDVKNSDKWQDGVVRRAILGISGNESLHLWTANKFRQLQGEKPFDERSIYGSYYQRNADATFAYFRYYNFLTSTASNSKIKTIPFHRVVVGNFPDNFFKGKIVLVGPSYISQYSDYVLTPLDRERASASKLAVHAQIISSIIQNKTVQTVPLWVSMLLSAAFALLMIFAMGKMRPTGGLFITIGLSLCVVISSYMFFVLFGIDLPVVHQLLTIIGVYYISIPFRAIIEYRKRFAIEEEAELLKKVEGLKQNFISLMSHDLKTPVAKIAGMADVLYHQNQNNIDNKKGLMAIIDATKELNKFITSILDLTKIESRNMRLNLAHKDLNQIIESVVEELHYEADKKNVEVKTELSALYPIEMDQILIKRVISNLLENAIKYSGENTSVVLTTWDDPDWVYLQVADTGKGIPKEDLLYVFEKFYRVKNDDSHKIKGTGLGLYLAKYFVELHGGIIDVQSEIGKGTTFTLKFKNA